MTYATETMTAAVDDAIAWAKETGSPWPAGKVETKIGSVYVSLNEARNGGSFDRHCKKNWKLNGKVISAAKLEAALNA